MVQRKVRAAGLRENGEAVKKVSVKAKVESLMQRANGKADLETLGGEVGLGFAGSRGQELVHGR